MDPVLTTKQSALRSELIEIMDILIPMLDGETHAMIAQVLITRSVLASCVTNLENGDGSQATRATLYLFQRAVKALEDVCAIMPD